MYKNRPLQLYLLVSKGRGLGKDNNRLVSHFTRLPVHPKANEGEFNMRRGGSRGESLGGEDAKGLYTARY